MRVVGSVCLVGTNGVQDDRFLFSVSWGVKTWLGGRLAGVWVWSGVVALTGLRWVGPRDVAAGRAAQMPCRTRFWVRGCGLGGRECGSHRGAGSR